jgi:hypothetical protein
MYDITSGISEAIMSSFADDTKIWRGILTGDCEQKLQNELNHIYEWAEANNMEFNTEKFQAIRFQDVLNVPDYKGSDGSTIKQAKFVKDLGLQISDDLSFTRHIQSVIKKGNQMAGWILRVFKGRSQSLLQPLLKQLVIPRMEYCSVLWSPHSQVLINRLESVQKNFTSKIDFTDEPERLNYWERLKKLKIYSLQRRRERYSIIYVWKVLYGEYPNPGIGLNQVFPAIHCEHQNRGIDITAINERTSEITTGHDSGENPRFSQHSILNRCCKLFNAIPPSLRQLTVQDSKPSHKAFKSALDQWLQKIPDQPTIPGHLRLAATNSILHQKDYITPTTNR